MATGRKKTIHRSLVTCLTVLLLISAGIDGQEKEIRVPKGHFLPNYRDIEIRDFLKTMAQITGKNILVDDTVKGKITIVGEKPIPVTRAYDFLKQVLEVRGFAVVEEPNLIKVLPMDTATSSSIPTNTNPDENTAGIVSRVVQLPNSVNLNEMTNMLKGIVGKGTIIIPYRPTNSVVITGYAQNVRRALTIAEELIPQLDGKKSDGGGERVHIYRVKNMPAETLASVLVKLDNPPVPDSVPATEGQPVQPKPQTGGKIQAVAHKESNAIIVTASLGEWNEILGIIEDLDQPRSQILLEVLIAEVSSTSLNDFGIDWRYQGRNAAHTQFNTGKALEGNLVDTETGKITGNNTLSGFSLGFLKKGGELMGIFNANVQNQNFNVLSAPQVLTLDNQEAEINVGQDVPVRTQERSTGGGTAEATVNSFDYRPSGIKLKFTPHINADGMISLDLFSEVTNIEGANSTTTNPTFKKRNVKTYITLQNKQTIVLGGLVNTEKTQTVSKIPILGDIPLIGFIFRRTVYQNNRTNLMIFLTPHVLDERGEADRVSNYKRQEQIKASRERSNDLKLWPETYSPEVRKDEFEANEDEPLED